MSVASKCDEDGCVPSDEGARGLLAGLTAPGPAVVLSSSLQALVRGSRRQPPGRPRWTVLRS